MSKTTFDPTTLSSAELGLAVHYALDFSPFDIVYSVRSIVDQIGWLAELFGALEEGLGTLDMEVTADMVSPGRLRRLAAMGRYLADDAEDTTGLLFEAMQTAHERAMQGDHHE